MNDCSQTKTLLILAADGELDPERSAWLETHVPSCPPCYMEQVRFRELDRNLGEYAEFLEQAAPVATPRRSIRATVRWIPALVAALAALLFVGVILVRRPSPAPPNVAIDEPFVPIPYVQPLDPYETATVMRMEVSVAALTAAGYKVDMTDPTAVVKADVLVGEDGRVHAVRILSGLVLN